MVSGVLVPSLFIKTEFGEMIIVVASPGLRFFVVKVKVPILPLPAFSSTSFGSKSETVVLPGG